MTNILLEGYDINAPWLIDYLKPYIKPFHKAAIIALAFRDSRVKNLDDWNALYKKDQGCYYSGIVGSLADYGIPENQIEFINYFTDTPETANEKIRNADILYFPGGLPDRMMERIREMQIFDSILHHEGIILGCSAGAVIQLREYHLSPDKDYPEFAYCSGFPFLDDFYLEVHYEGTPEQIASIKRVLREKQKPVFATHYMSGAIVVNNGEINLIGSVSKFDCPNKRERDHQTGSMDSMIIKEAKNKRDYLPLLLLADEQENLIDLYLDRGTMFVLEEQGMIKGECVVTDEGEGVLEIQNLAVAKEYQNHGYGKALINFVADRYKNKYTVLQVGTGDGPLTVPFYEHCGFTIHHVIRNYIVDHYDNPIFEGGKQLIDKVYLRRNL